MRANPVAVALAKKKGNNKKKTTNKRMPLILLASRPEWIKMETLTCCGPNSVT